LNNYGRRFARLRTKDGYMIGSVLTQVGSKSRNNSCVKYELEVQNQKESYELGTFYGCVLYYLVHEYAGTKYMLAYVHNAQNVNNQLYNLKTFAEFGVKEFIPVSAIRKC
ncbi:33458_t:CDS:2, partial [Gigaspora margarita]